MQNMRIVWIRQNSWLTSNPQFEYIKQTGRVVRYTLGLWDTDMSQFKGQLAHVLSLGNCVAPRVPFNSTSRLCHHLALVRDSAYAIAVTVYVSVNGIKGIKAHFSSGEFNMFGQTEGCYTLHFALAEGEYLTSAWISSKEAHYRSVQRSDFVLAVRNNDTQIRVLDYDADLCFLISRSLRVAAVHTTSGASNPGIRDTVPSRPGCAFAALLRPGSRGSSLTRLPTARSTSFTMSV